MIFNAFSLCALLVCTHIYIYSSSMAAARNGSNSMPWPLIDHQHVVVSLLRSRHELVSVLRNTMYRRLAAGDPSYIPMYGSVRNFSCCRSRQLGGSLSSTSFFSSYSGTRNGTLSLNGTSVFYSVSGKAPSVYDVLVNLPRI